MASVTKAEIPKESEFMTEFWKLIKMFWIPEPAEEYWDKLVNAGCELYKKYPTEFSKAMIFAFQEYLERRLMDGQ